MRKELGIMSLRLSALCGASTGQARLIPCASAAPSALQRLQTPLRLASIRALSAQTGSGRPYGLFAVQAQSSARPTQISYAAQYGFDQPAESNYTVGKMPWDSMAANAVSLIGNTGKEVEIKRLETGRIVGNVTLACAHKAGQTAWYDVDIWGPMAERVAEQVPKGSHICVQGRLNPVTWTNREGVKQTKWKISATEFRFVDRQQPPPGQQQGGWGQAQPQQQQQGWGGAQDTFEQQPPSGSEWGHANNVVPSQQPEAPAGLLTQESSAEDKWKSVTETPNLWWNNTTNKRNPRAPDFKLKNDGGVVLWINSRDTPEWARQKFESSGVTPAYQASGFTDMN